MARKYVRFNYFEIQLVPADLAVIEELGGQAVPYQANAWNMGTFLDYLAIHREQFNTNVPVGDEYAEIEKDSHSFDEQRNIYSFQLSKLREKNIPSKKRFGEIKEDILLQQDEFIGEFVSFVYDNTYNVAIVQSNLYGLSIKQIEHVLTQLRFRYMDEVGRVEQVPLVVQLVPLIDRSKIDRVVNADYYKKIRLRGSDVMLDANLGDNNLLSDARRVLNECSGVQIDITISLGRAEKTATLDVEAIRRAIEEFRQIQEGNPRPLIELTALENEEAEVETINLIEPRMTDRVPIDIEPRQTVAHEYLYQSFLFLYDTRRPDVRRVMRPL